MSVKESEKQLQKMFFQAKLAAEKQTNDVVKAVKAEKLDFVLLDTRDRASYEKEHLPGAVSMPLDEVDKVAKSLDRNKEYVTYCWHGT